MEIVLNDIEARILGVLIEKQMSTPDYYPMTLNALKNACNQKSNRFPVMNLDEAAVEQTVTSLRNKRLIWQIKIQGSRALKYEHNMQDVADYSVGQLAILCELLLRGPQTGGELRSRTTRLTEFSGLPAVERALHKLAEHEKGPFVVQLPRAPGQKENRYAHLFSEIDPDEMNSESSGVERLTVIPNPDNDRIEALEKKVDELNSELTELAEQFLEFKRQFE